MFRHPYVFDGQHTIEIVASRSGSRDTPVWCMVYDQLQYQEEAHIFAEQQRHVKALVPYESFKAHIEANDEKQMMINDLVRSYGLEISPSKKPGTICAVPCLVLRTVFNAANIEPPMNASLATPAGDAKK